VTDGLLDALRATRQGRLKVFLGMSAGLGKTVAMLREARCLRDEGIDAVCAFALTLPRGG
jgi:two-component system, OmpR family, sensor histidine kinase KdpD